MHTYKYIALYETKIKTYKFIKTTSDIETECNSKKRKNFVSNRKYSKILNIMGYKFM